MGFLVDVVPNHMSIVTSENRWWQDVLENGPGSPFARYFDVDWNPPNPTLKGRVLLPILGDQFGRVLERQELRVSYRDGAFLLNYWETQLPVAARSSILVLQLALEGARALLGESDPHVFELESIVNALEHLPPRTETDPTRAARAPAREGGRPPAPLDARQGEQRGTRRRPRRARAPQRHEGATRELRPSGGADRAAGLPPELLARRLRRDQLPTLLRRQRAGRRPRRGATRLHGRPRGRPPPRPPRAGHGAARRPRRRPARPSEVPRRPPARGGRARRC